MDKDIEALKNRVLSCERCHLSKTRNNVVFGEGDYSKGIVFVGEAPGRNEDIKGRPFVGSAGRLLDDILNKIGIKRKDIFITNIVKCRPPNNRNPTKQEIETCSYWLDLQIKLIKPKVIVTLGNFSTRYFLNKIGINKSISFLHGKVFIFKEKDINYKILPIYHPAAALYNRNLAEDIEKDLMLLKEMV